MIGLFLTCGVALAFPGLRSDGIVPAPGVAEGGLVLLHDWQLGRQGASGSAYGAAGLLGVAEEIGLGLTLAWVDGALVGGELRGAAPLLGRRDDPVLTLLLGADATGPFDPIDELPWWLEGGLVAGVGLPAALRLNAGATLNWELAGGQEGLWVEPSLGLSWRPGLSERLTLLLDAELAASLDLDLETVELGPALLIGVAGR